MSNDEIEVPMVERFKLTFPTLQVDWQVGDRVYSPVVDGNGMNHSFPGSGVVLEILPHSQNKLTVVHIQYSYSKYVNTKGEHVRIDTTDYLEEK